MSLDLLQLEEFTALISQYEYVFGGCAHFQSLAHLGPMESIIALRIALGTRTPLPPPPDPTFVAPKTCAASFRRERIAMVKEQLRRSTWPITNRRVLRAMRNVPREFFVPDVLKPYAYRDSPLPIGWGQTISQPYMVGLMSQLLSPAQGERILEIGTGSGYQAAILADMGAVVYTIEVIPELSERATRVLASLGYKTITLQIGNGFKGWPEEAPFDGIILTCATDKLPEALREQLKKNGKVVIPMGNSQGQWLTLLTKREHVLQRHVVAPVRFVPMTFENAHLSGLSPEPYTRKDSRREQPTG